MEQISEALRELEDPIARLIHTEWKAWTKAVWSDVAPHRTQAWKRMQGSFDDLPPKAQTWFRRWTHHVLRIVDQWVQDQGLTPPSAQSARTEETLDGGSRENGLRST